MDDKEFEESLKDSSIEVSEDRSFTDEIEEDLKQTKIKKSEPKKTDHIVVEDDYVEEDNKEDSDEEEDDDEGDVEDEDDSSGFGIISVLPQIATALVAIGIVLAVGFIVVSEISGSGQISAMYDSSQEAVSEDQSQIKDLSTNITITTLTEVANVLPKWIPIMPKWIPIIVITAIAVLLLGLIRAFIRAFR